MKLAKGVKLQLRIKTTAQGTVIESTQAPMAPEEARAFWRDVADHAHRMSLEDVTETHPLPNALSSQPRQGGHVRERGGPEAAGLVVDV